MSDVLLPIKIGGRFGFCDRRGNQVLEAEYVYGSQSSEGIAVATNFAGNLVLIDASKLTARELPEFADNGCEFSNKLLSVRPHGEDQPTGFIDREGTVVIEPQFDFARNFDRCGATVRMKRGDMAERRIEPLGKPVGEPYLAIGFFHPKGLFAGAHIAWGEGGEVIIDGSGNRVGKRTFDIVWQEHEGLIPVRYEWGLVGWLTTDGQDVHRLAADAVGNHFESGLVPVEELGGKWVLMNAEGKWVVDPPFDVIESVGPGRYLIGHRDADEDPTVRLADARGNILADEVFESIDRFSDGIASVWRIKHHHTDRDNVMEFNFIDMDGNVLLPTWS
jgi:hypothetical protein